MCVCACVCEFSQYLAGRIDPRRARERKTSVCFSFQFPPSPLLSPLPSPLSFLSFFRLVYLPLAYLHALRLSLSLPFLSLSLTLILSHSLSLSPSHTHTHTHIPSLSLTHLLTLSHIYPHAFLLLLLLFYFIFIFAFLVMQWARLPTCSTSPKIFSIMAVMPPPTLQRHPRPRPHSKAITNNPRRLILLLLLVPPPLTLTWVCPRRPPVW